jgi:hypothetical protein
MPVAGVTSRPLTVPDVAAGMPSRLPTWRLIGISGHVGAGLHGSFDGHAGDALQRGRLGVGPLGACGADQVARVLQQRLGAGSFVAGERVPSGFEVADLRERLLVVRFVLSPAGLRHGCAVGQVERGAGVSVHAGSP